MTQPMPHGMRRGAWRSRASIARAFAISIGAVCSACTPERHVPPLVPTQPPPVVTEPLDLTVRVRAERDGQKWGVVDGDTLKTGDFLELFVHLNQPAYLYVLQLLPDGKPRMLFPDQGDRRLTAGTEHRIPAINQSLQIDARDREEDIYVVMSRIPVASVGPLASALGPPRKHNIPPPPRQPRPQSEVVLTITTRGVIVVNRPGLEPRVTDARNPYQGSTLVVRLSFKHV